MTLKSKLINGVGAGMIALGGLTAYADLCLFGLLNNEDYGPGLSQFRNIREIPSVSTIALKVQTTCYGNEPCTTQSLERDIDEFGHQRTSYLGATLYRPVPEGKKTEYDRLREKFVPGMYLEFPLALGLVGAGLGLRRLVSRNDKKKQKEAPK